MSTAIPPTLEQRLGMREPPRSRPIGFQRWNHLLFLHWRMPAEVIQAALPAGLSVDTFAGEAWLGIVPFFMQRIRPAFLPPVPWLSWFLELNVRTYVHDAAGRPGVYFFSLDCNQPVAVALARRFFHLPYHHARMQARFAGGKLHYTTLRRGMEGEAARFCWRPEGRGVPADPGSLEFFLAERYALFSINPRGQIREGRVHHAPYRLWKPELECWSAAPAGWDGFPLHGPPDSVLAAERVDVAIYRLTGAGD